MHNTMSLKSQRILENVVRCKYFEAGVHIKNPIKNSYQDGLGRTPQTLDHVVVVHILIWDKIKSQINDNIVILINKVRSYLRPSKKRDDLVIIIPHARHSRSHKFNVDSFWGQESQELPKDW